MFGAPGPNLLADYYRDDKSKEYAGNESRFALREPDEELQRQKFAVARLWSTGIGGCARMCICNCCRKKTTFPQREARFQRATTEKLAEVDVSEILASAEREEEAKIRAALADIEQGREDLEAVVYQSAVEVDKNTVPCPCTCWACCAGGLVCNDLHRIVCSCNMYKRGLLSCTAARYRPQMTTCAFVTACFFAVFLDPLLVVLFAYMTVVLTLMLCCMDSCCVCCTYSYLRCTCRDDNACRFKRVERLYLLTGVDYQPPSKYTPERAAAHGWMYKWEYPSLTWGQGVRRLWCPPPNNNPASRIFDPAVMSRRFYLYGAPHLFADALSPQEEMKLAEYKATRKAVTAEMLSSAGVSRPKDPPRVPYGTTAV